MTLKIKAIIFVVVTLIAAGSIYATIQWLQDTGRQEIQVKQLETEIETRKNIDEAIRTSPRGADDADSLLREFLNSSD